MVTRALHLFDGPYAVVDGQRRDVPGGCGRLVVFVALGGTRVGRRVVAGTLWPLVTDERAAGNLRSALWRLRGAGLDLVEADQREMWLAPGTEVDAHVVATRGARLAEGRPLPDDLDPRAWRTLGRPLLPGWYDDWVIFERELLRQRQLHGMEALGRHLVRERRYAEAVEAGLRVVAVDPIRESAQRVLIEAHLAAGDLAEARAAFGRYRVLISRELGVAPGPELFGLVGVDAARGPAAARARAIVGREWSERPSDAIVTTT